MVCDRPEKLDELKRAYEGMSSSVLLHLSLHLTLQFAVALCDLGTPGVTVLPDGHHVSRTSDFIMYSVEAEFIDRVVAEYGPCELPNSIQFSIASLAPSPIFFSRSQFPVQFIFPFLLPLVSYMSHPFSYESRSHCCWTNLRQSSRKGGI